MGSCPVAISNSGAFAINAPICGRTSMHTDIREVRLGQEAKQVGLRLIRSDRLCCTNICCNPEQSSIGHSVLCFGRPALRRFGSAELDRIRLLRMQGASVRQLAKQLGTTQWMVAKLTAPMASAGMIRPGDSERSGSSPIFLARRRAHDEAEEDDDSGYRWPSRVNPHRLHPLNRFRCVSDSLLGVGA
jgi:hypothetical protein